MKNLKLLVVALVAMFGFIACEQHECNDYDHSADLVGTWTCLQEGYAEALVIKTDGTALSTGYDGEEFWENVAGSFVVENGMVTMTFEDGDNFHGHFDIIPGMAFSIYTDEGNRFTFNYCKEDLSEEILGMWVCTEKAFGHDEESTVITTYKENGKCYLSGFLPETNGYINQIESDYKVIGNMIISPVEDGTRYLIREFDIIPNGTELGDIMTTRDLTSGTNPTFLRIKQYLELANNSYDYNNIYVTNVKAKDAEFEFAGQTLNLANMDGRILDKMMKTLLFNVSFPSADKIVYNYHYNGENVPVPSPIVVDGNKMTIKKSVNNPACKDIDVWAFQDQDNTQMHMYMHVTSFENFLANTVVEMLANEGKLDLNDAAAVKVIFDQVEAAIETINVSFIFKTAK